MDNSNIVVPFEKRQPNRVDLLENEIIDLQTNCDHNFVPLNLVMLQESLVPNVFLVNTKLGKDVPDVKTQCTKCSLKREFSVTEKCPVCMGQMKSTGSLDYREKYHGVEYLYFRSRTYVCGNCSFTLVADEWDQ